MKSLLWPLATACLSTSATFGFDMSPGGALDVEGDVPLVSDTPLELGQRVAFDMITDRSGAQPWEQLRVLLDYADPSNHTSIILTSFNTLVITEVRDGQRRKIADLEGRGEALRWQHVEFDTRPEGLVLRFRLKTEMLIPWRDPKKPGHLAFSADNGAAGRVKLLRQGPAPRTADGTLKLHPFFSDHAVLPHGRTVLVNGKAAAGSEVLLFLDDVKAGSAKTSADGQWEISLPPQQPGGPHRLAVESDGRRLERSDLLFGEVWFCSGQSNMQWRLGDSDNADSEAERLAGDDRLRVFSADIETSDSEQPFPLTPAEWRPGHASTARHLSAIGQIFGHELSQGLGMPVGIVVSARGGSRIEPWMSSAARAAVEKQIGPYSEEYRAKLAEHESAPGSLFNAMLAPYLRIPFSGVIWYQGESNAWRGWHYRPQLAALITDWRAHWGRPDLPFLVVQLPSFAGKDMGPNDPVWTDMREAQALVAQETDNVNLVVALDLGDPHDIHPTAKRPIAERLAAAALRHVHGREDVVADPPRVVKTEPVPGGMAIEFDRPVRLAAKGASDFQLAEGDGAFQTAREVRQPAPEKIEALAATGHPTQVRYAWKNVAQAALGGPEGLPVAPFRTDSRPTLSTDLY